MLPSGSLAVMTDGRGLHRRALAGIWGEGMAQGGRAAGPARSVLTLSIRKVAGLKSQN